jgi:hypothetical protein
MHGAYSVKFDVNIWSVDIC